VPLLPEAVLIGAMHRTSAYVHVLHALADDNRLASARRPAILAQECAWTRDLLMGAVTLLLDVSDTYSTAPLLLPPTDTAPDR